MLKKHSERVQFLINFINSVGKGKRRVTWLVVTCVIAFTP